MMKYLFLLLISSFLTACNNPIYVTTDIMEFDEYIDEELPIEKPPQPLTVNLKPITLNLRPVTLPSVEEPLTLLEPPPMTPLVLPPALPASPPSPLLLIKRSASAPNQHSPIIPDNSLPNSMNYIPLTQNQVTAPSYYKEHLPAPSSPPVLLAQVTDIPPPIPILEEQPLLIVTPPPPPLLDILFVSDTSDSMYKNLMNFRKKFRDFLSILNPFNWQWAITNTDCGDTAFSLFDLAALKGQIMKLEEDGVVLERTVLNPSVPNYENIFLDTISLHQPYQYENEWYEGLEDQYLDQCDLPPFCQSYQEQPLKALKMALSKNSHFFRDTANLAVVITTNSQERADNPELATLPEEVIQQFSAVHGTEKIFKVYGVIILNDDQECMRTNKETQWFFPEGSHSEKVAQLAQKTGGKIFNICSADYKNLALSIYNDFIDPATDKQ